MSAYTELGEFLGGIGLAGSPEVGRVVALASDVVTAIHKGMPTSEGWHALRSAAAHFAGSTSDRYVVDRVVLRVETFERYCEDSSRLT